MHFQRPPMFRGDGIAQTPIARLVALYRQHLGNLLVASVRNDLSECPHDGYIANRYAFVKANRYAALRSDLL